MKHPKPERREDAVGVLRTGGLMALAAVSIIAFVFLSLGQTRDTILQREAQSDAIRWAGFFEIRIPDLATAFASGRLAPHQIALIDDGMLVGEVFRFKLIDTEGQAFYVSDTGEFSVAGDLEVGALAALATDEPVVDLLDGSQRRDRPIRYAEAYVPFADDAGEVVGVIEVYVDQTSTFETISAGFNQIRIGLPLLCALVYLIPAIGLSLARRQQRRGAASLEAARYDALTGVLDRRHFEVEASAALDRAIGFGTATGILFVDLDHFKDVNDKVGHLGGDAYLQFITGAVISNVDSRAIIGRYGGDEIVISLPGIDEVALAATAEALCQAVRRPFVFRGQSIRGSLSIGWYLAPPGTALKQALDEADRALYRAKKDGRDRACGVGPGAGPGHDRNDAA